MNESAELRLYAIGDIHGRLDLLDRANTSSWVCVCPQVFL